MGGLVTTLRDIKIIIKDLKITLKLTAKVILKVHSIVEDFEETVQELKRTVKCVSTRISPEGELMQESTLNSWTESVETTAESLKQALADVVGQVSTKDLFRSTQENWEKVMEYSRESSRNVAELMAQKNAFPKFEKAAERPAAKAEETMLYVAGKYSIASRYGLDKGRHSSSSDAAEVKANARAPETMSSVTHKPIESLDNFSKTLDVVTISLPNQRRHTLQLSNHKDVLNVIGLIQSMATTKICTKSVLPKGILTAKHTTNDRMTGKLKPGNAKQLRTATAEVSAAELLRLLLIFAESISVGNHKSPKEINRKWKNQDIFTNLGNRMEIIELDDWKDAVKRLLKRRHKTDAKVKVEWVVLSVVLVLKSFR